MKKWLKIGSIAGAIALGLVVLGIAAFVMLRPAAVEAQNLPGTMFDGMAMNRFNGPGQFGPMNQQGNFGRGGRFGGQIDYDSLLAEALGISVEELQAAREQADAVALQQAVEQGLISQEQADLMAARRQLVNYLDQDVLLAQALGISTEELQAALDEGKPPVVLAWEQGLDPAALRANLQTAHAEAMQQAVADGVITQEQADQLQNRQKVGPRGGPRGGFGFPGGRMHGGGFGRQ